MAWLILASVVAIVSLAAGCPHSQQTTPWNFPGTDCSAINFNKSCCLPDAECYAIDGRCSCSPHCHSDNDIMCCKDIHCYPVSRSETCQDFGCCFKNLTSSECQYATLNIGGTEMDVDCRIKSAECPETCSEAKRPVGYCKWNTSERYNSCYVEYGECYCDPFCVHFNDCCADVKELIRHSIRDGNPIIQIIKFAIDLEESNAQARMQDGINKSNQYELALAARLMSMDPKH